MQQVDWEKVPLELSRLLERALAGEEVVITRDDQPVLKLTRVSTAKPRRRPGSAKGLIVMADDFDAPIEDFDPYLS